MGFSRSRRRALFSRRAVRLVAIAVFFTLSGVTAMGSADAAALPQATVRFSGVAAFVKSLFADAVGMPRQASGSAAGKGGEVSAAATRAGKGAGRAPGKGAGELATYSPLAHKSAAGKSGVAHKGFDAKSSTRNTRKSNAFSDWFDNADGSYTVKTSQSPVNYRAADGSWQPIDADLTRAADSRLHERANGVAVSFAGGGGSVGSASSGSGGDLAGPRTVRSAGSSPAGSSAGQLVSLSLGGSQQVGWSLSGAASVSPVVSGATAEYDGILPDTSLALTAENWGVKETFTLAGASAPNSWRFPLALSGVSVKDDPVHGWELVDGAGAVVARLSVPFAYDSVVFKAQHPNTTYAVSYSVATDSSGAQSLVLTLDKAWLDDPARVFPVTVDPTVTVGDAGVAASTYIQYSESNNNSSNGRLHVGYSDWTSPTVKARSFIYFDTMPVGQGYHVTQANVGIFDIWAATCTAEPFDIYPVTSSNWTNTSINSTLTWTDSTYNGPSRGASMGEVSASPGAACTNNSGTYSTGTWMYPQLDTNVVNQWTATNASSYHGIEIAAPSESNDLEWKIFDSTLVSSNSPYIYITYTPNVAPQVNSTSPASGYNAPTLTPTLSVNATDPDGWPNLGLGYEYQVFDGANDQKVADSQPSGASCVGGTKPSTGASWTVPAGKLKWGQSYFWAVDVCDGDNWSGWSASSGLVTAVPPPLLTSNLSQNTSGHGFDPALGNYTASATDAQVATVGPALTITRDYNSLDPRVTQALGAGWSSLLDARAAEAYDTSGSNVTSVTVTYPDGSEVGFGKNSDGSFAAPLGRFATFIAVTGGGYSLTDKNDTVYTFTVSLGSGVYGLTSITDAAGRTLSVGWTSGQITTLTSASGRALHVAWNAASGSVSAHVKSIATDPVTVGSTAAPLTWTYNYQGNQLSSVCPPTSLTACTGYQYAQTVSQYRTALLDGGPSAYWPLSDASGGTAGDLVLSNEHGKDATYANVSANTSTPPGLLKGSGASAASFNGTSSDAVTSGKVLDTTASFTVSAWVSLPSTPSGFQDVVAQDGVQNTGFELQYDATDSAWAFARTTSDTANAVSVKAHATSAPALNTPTFLVGVYDAGAQVLRLYVNGQPAGTAPFTAPFATSGALTIGRGKWNGASTDFFHGLISDVAVYQAALPAAAIGQLYTAGTTLIPELTLITRPSNTQAAQISYDAVSGRVSSVVDGNGSSWGLGAPSVSGSAEGYRAAVMGAAPSAYWRLGDAAGASTASDEVAADGSAMTYQNTPTLGASGPLNSSQSAATFDGSTQYAATGGAVLNTTASYSISAWVNLASTTQEYQTIVGQSAADGGDVYLEYSPTFGGWSFILRKADNTASGLSAYDYASSNTGVAANTWTHLVGVFNTAGGKDTMSLYVNGKLASSATDTTPWQANGLTSIGAVASASGVVNYTNGKIAEVALFPSALDGSTVAAMYAAGKNAAGLNPTESVTVTDPGNKTLTYEYDPVNGTRPIAQIDALGAKTTYGYDTSGFLHTVVDPNGDETITGHDVRGNTVSQTTCQNQAANSCSTSYYTYLPDDTTAQLITPSPSNDMLATASDGRSSGNGDATYRTTYTYDKFGDRATVTTPPVPGYPAGRTATTVYTDGSMTYPASDDTSKPVPPGLPWTQTSAGGAVTQYNYFADGDLYSATSPTTGMITVFTYDELGRPTMKRQEYTSGGTCSYVNGVLVCPAGHTLTTTTAYDGLNRAVTVTGPAVTDRVTGNTHQAQTTTVYDVDGNQTSQTISDVGSSPVHDDPRTTVNHYNSHDQLDWSMDAQQNADGNGTSASPNLADATQYAYDAYGNKTRVISPQDQNGRSTTTDFGFDAAGRLLYSSLENYTGSPSGSQSTVASQTLEARNYDPAGRLASVIDAMGFATFYQYYDDNRTAKVTRCQSTIRAVGTPPMCNGSSFVQESDSYDGAGDATTRVTNNGATETDYSYDAAGRQTSSTVDPHGLNRTTTDTYNADDLVVSQRTGDANGSGTTDYQYNADGAMTAQSVEDYTTGAPVGWWKLNDGTAGSTPSTARDWSGQNNTGTLNSGVTWSSGAASFNGTSGSIATSGPVLNTTASYSISAWVNLASTTQEYQTIVGQSAADGGNMYLEYSPTFGGWSFILRKADNTASGLSAYDYASSNTGVAANTWTHLVAVYNSSTGAMRLYVNGAVAANATDTTPWQANGLTSIGAVANASGTVNYTDGQIANVQIYQRVLSGNDVSALYTNGRGGAALSSSSNTTTWALDGRDLPISMTDANGQSTSYTYDEAGRRAITQQPTVTAGTYSASGGYTSAQVAPVTTTGYDTFGDAVESKDPTGVQTTTVFDLDGRPTATKLPDYQQPGAAPNNQLLSGQKSVTQYNELGQKTESWDPAGTATTYGYDQLGHLTTATQDPGGLNRTTATAYDLDGDPLQVTDPSGAIQAATYDYLGRTLTSTQVLGLGGSGSTQLPAGCGQYNNIATQAACTTSYYYTDTAGFLSKTTSPSGTQSTQYGYDAAGEPTSVIDGVNQSTSTAYDYAGRAIKTTLPDGTYSTTTYDQAGQATAQAQYDSGNTLLRSAGATYDADGNTLSSTDPNGNTTHFTYDNAGRLTSESQPASYTSTLSQVPSVTQTITTSFGYDAAGRQTQYVTGNLNTWYTTYNSRGLPESTLAPATTAYSTPAASTTTLTYDADARPVEQDAPGAVTQTKTYDNLGEVLTQSGASTNSADAPSATRQFTYFPSGLPKTATTTNTAASGSNATSESFTYDDSGALVSSSGTAGTSAFTYTADGQMATRADTVAGTQYTTGYSYDGAGRLSSLSDPLTAQNLTYAYTPNSLNYTVTYGTGGDVRTFQYNTAHELASDTLKTPGGSTVASITYGYDANGNETGKTTTGFAGAAANTYTYDQAGRLKSWNNGTTVTAYGYDQDSNRTNVGGNTYTYDARDQLTSDGTNTYTYTARGTLQTTTSATGTLTTTADAYNQQTASGTNTYTYDALGRVTAAGTSQLTYSGMTNQVASTTSTAVYSRDPSGALIGVKVSPSSPGTIAYTDQHTDLVARFHPTDTSLTISTAYDPLGNVLATAGNQVALGYQSEYTSGGKVNMAARWYNPATGQFTSKDTATNSPVPNSANANPFAYGNDNPLTSIDPDGHRACGADGQCFGTVTADHGAGNEARAYNDYQAIVARQQANTEKIISQYIENEDARCGARQGCVNGRIRALRSIKVGKDGHTLTGDPAAIADLKSIVGAGAGGGDSGEQGGGSQSHKCNWNPLTWGGCAQNVVHWAGEHPLATALIVAAVVSCVVGCAAAAGALAIGAGSLGGTAVALSTACITMCAATGAAAFTAFWGTLYGTPDMPSPADAGVGEAVAADSSDAGAAERGAADASGAEAVAAGVMKSSAGALDISAKTLESIDSDLSDLSDVRPPAATDPTPPTKPKTGGGSETTSAPQNPVDPVRRPASLTEPDASASDPAPGDPAEPGCPAPHSFTGDTPVLMADGTAKPIDQVKAGDKITNAAPDGMSETHTVDKVIVTTTDHDFAALTLTPLRTTASGPGTNADAQASAANAPGAQAANGLSAPARTKIAGAALAAALLLAPAAGAPAQHHPAGPHSEAAPTAGLTTTYHHAFYDATTNQWTQAQNLRPGDLLQTPTGYALLDAVHLYHADTTTYDLTVDGLHTYYVVAGNTPVLVHNVNPDECPITGLVDRLTQRRSDIVDSTSKRMRPGTISEMQTQTPSGLTVVTYGRSGFMDSLNSDLENVYAAEDISNGRCSEMQCLNSVLNMGLNPRGSVVQAMGILSKRIGTNLDGQLMDPCEQCSRVLRAFDITAGGS